MPTPTLAATPALVLLPPDRQTAGPAATPPLPTGGPRPEAALVLALVRRQRQAQRELQASDPLSGRRKRLDDRVGGLGRELARAVDAYEAAEGTPALDPS